jgi:ankyrin repeat protein
MIPEGSSIRRALDELPKTLDETYARTLKEIDEQNWEYAHHLFQCVAAASRPLLVNELAGFLAFDFEAGSIPTFLPERRLEHPAHTVLSICSSLLAIVKPDGDSSVVQFAHYSVKQYLTSERLAKAEDTISRFHISTSMTPAHTVLAQACLGILLHLDENVTMDSLEEFPLAGYAAVHWVDHVRFEDVSSRVQEGMRCLFNPSKSHFSVWIWVLLRRSRRNRWRQSGFEKFEALPLHYAAFYGLHDIARFLIVERSQDVNAVSDYKTPLNVALRHGHVDVAQLLLEYGADAEAGDNDGTPLLLASRYGHVGVSRLLLERGAVAEPPDKNGIMDCTPLHAASSGGHVEVGRLLLGHGANVQARDGIEFGQNTPLLLASRGGHAEFVRLLLQHGADTEAKGMRGGSSLDITSSHGHVEATRVLLEHGAVKGYSTLHYAKGEEVARLLLKHGADANARNEGRAPLHLASYLGHVGTAQVLLEHGVDVNSRDDNNATPLHLACPRSGRRWSNPGYPDVVRLLLQYNADVHARDDRGRTPFMKARENQDIMELLLEHGVEDDEK